eukprot:Em0018g287a
MRNTAVLVKWIEEHQANPYPTKAEKQLLAYYSGMNLTQLSTWFANARRRIKKIGIKTWLEGRSTFSLDYFPTSSLQRPAMPGYAAADGTYATSPYSTYAPALSSLQGGYAATHHPALSAGQQAGNQRMPLNGTQSSLVYSDALPSSAVHQHQSSLSMNGLYGCTQKPSGLPTMTLGMSPFPVSNWSASSLVHPSGRSIAPLHSPLTGYSAEGSTHIRGHSGQALDVGDSSYSLQQHSPDQMLPECASSEPLLENSKTQSSLSN